MLLIMPCIRPNLKFSLFSRGYNIGVRLIDEFLAKSNVSRCVDFRETADVIAKVYF
jgi:Transport protein particle (TRAPP) component